MGRLMYIIKRIIFAIPVLLFGLTVTFLILYLGPLDPVTAILGRDYNEVDARRIAIQLGLRYENGDPVPIWQQYQWFLMDLFTGKFGDSWVVAPDTPVKQLIQSKIKATVWLGFWSVLLPLFIGLPLGFYAGMNPNTWGDYFASFGGIVWRAMPNFWLAVMLSSVMSSGGWLEDYRFLGPDKYTTDVIGTPDTLNDLFYVIDPIPLTGFYPIDLLGIPIPLLMNDVAWVKSIKWILPAALVLGSASMANELRIGRTAVLETINSKYVETAKAKGVSSRKIISKHVFRNALIPLLPVIMSEFYLLIGGSVLVEQVFAINGLGQLFVTASFRTDIPVIGALMFIFISMALIFNIIQDVLYTVIDPRVGFSES